MIELIPELAEKLRQQIIRHEGKIPYAYHDNAPERYLTIGVGHCIDPRIPGAELPDFIISVLLDYDLGKVQRQLIAALPWFVSLDPPRQAVLMDMAFNMGTAGVLKFSKALAAMRDGRFSDAAAEMLDSAWARQVGARAHHLATQMETGQWT